MHDKVVLVEVKNPKTYVWEYLKNNNQITSYLGSTNLFDIQSEINRKMEICHCELFDCCGSYFYELFSAIEKKHNASSLFKGLPNDISKEIAFQHTIWFEDIEMGHDASYLYLQDLMAFDYNQTIDKKSGWEEISGVHCTQSWSRILKNSYETKPTYRSLLGEKFFIDLDFLKTIGKPDEVRIVFWFWDNTNHDPDMDDILNHWTC